MMNWNITAILQEYDILDKKKNSIAKTMLIQYNKIISYYIFIE